LTVEDLAENSQLKQELLAIKDRQNSIEDMLLAISTDLPKEKMVSIEQILSDEAQKRTH
jgi:hypothetical protein